MYASDYPHLHVGALDAFLAVVPEDKRANVMSQTARHWYRL
jgi:predicted TIM-barrel fold metal-dependent hydrolase